MWNPSGSLSVARNRPKGKIDIGGELVRRGWALAYRRYGLICSLVSGRKLSKHETVAALSRSLVAIYVEGLSSAVHKGRYA